MVLNLTSCGSADSSGAEAPKETAVSTETVTEEASKEETVSTKTVTKVVVKSAQESVDPAQPASQETEADPVNARFNGLWITASSIGDLYYFDNGEVTYYINENYDPSAPDLHYKKVSTRHYTIKEINPDEGSGYKAVVEGGNEYWLKDEYSNMLQCSWYDENGDLQISGSDSLMPVADFTIDDLILDDAAAEAEADDAAAAEAETDAVAAAPATESPYATIVREYVDLDGQYYLINGFMGSDTDIVLLKYENGSFIDSLSLNYTYVDEEVYMINGENVDYGQWTELMNKIDDNSVSYMGCITGDFETEESLREGLEEGYASLGM